MFSFNETFDDEFYLIIDETLINYFDKIKPSLGDLVIYNNNIKCFDTLPKERIGKEDDKSIIGIVVNVNDDMTIDALMKTYLTSDKIIIPIKYFNKKEHIPAYIFNIFERYCSKYKREASIDILDIKYKIPSINFLDFLYKDINIFLETIDSVWGTERKNTFINRLYEHGLISIYKGKLYQWKPFINQKRQILNLNILTGYELLPMFTLKYQ